MAELVEGARLEIVFRIKPNVGSNPTSSAIHDIITSVGEMSEWLKETVLKTVVSATIPWVRIPLSPPTID